MNNQSQRRPGRRSGSAMIEFALVGSFIFIPMLAGLGTVGLQMVTGIRVANLNAGAGQMFSSGVDFSQAANFTMLQNIGTGSNLNFSSSGLGVIILSEIQNTSNGIQCVSQFIVGNPNQGSATYTSQFAPAGAGQAATDPFSSAMASGQIAYVAETYYNISQYAWALAPTGTGNKIYVKAVF
jgi:hypothetical protein